MDSFNPGAWGPIYVGTWAGRPDAATLPTGTRIVITDVGNQGPFEMQVVGGVWRLLGATVVYLNETQYVGSNASTAEQVLFTTPGLHRSFYAAMRYYSVSAVLSKSGASTTAPLVFREGGAGTISDAAVYNSSGALGTASVRSGQGGIVRKYNGSTTRTQVYTALQNLPLEGGNGSTSGWPYQLSNPLPDALIYTSVSVNLAASGSDIPALERVMIVGY